DRARRRLERARVDASPDDLENGGITRGVLGDEGCFRVRDGLGPALPGFEDLGDPLEAPARCFLVLDGFLDERGFRLVPVLFVVRVRRGLGGLDNVRHASPPWRCGLPGRLWPAP